MKIGLVRRGYSPTGGAESYLARLASGLCAEGHEAILFTSAAWPDNRWEHGEITRIDGSSPRAFADALTRAKHDCDCIFSLERLMSCDLYRAGDGVHAAWLERRARFEPWWKKVLRPLNTKHAQILELEHSLFAGRHAGRIVANSRMVRDEIIRFYGYPAERIEIIPNGISPLPPASPMQRHDARERAGVGPGEFVALFAGSGWGRKGLAAAIAAASRVKGCRLLVAGKGDRRHYRAGSNIIFLGPVADMAGVWPAADAFILPTIYDPFSNACLEALAAGLPVITTAANGFSEIITAGRHGDVIGEPGDVEALAAALENWRVRRGDPGVAEECRLLAGHYSIEENARRTIDAISRFATRG